MIIIEILVLYQKATDVAIETEKGTDQHLIKTETRPAECTNLIQITW